MKEFMLFLSTFCSYLLVMVVIAVVGAIAMYIGIRLRKKKNAEENKAADVE